MEFNTRVEPIVLKTPAKPRRIGRPRDAALRMAVMKAANEILKERGIAGFAIEAVATRAGVAKTTIYRWWPSKGALAIAAFLTEVAPKTPYIRDTTAISAIEDQVKRVAQVYSGSNGLILSAILAEGQRDPATIQAFINGYARPRREEARTILRLGIAQGELRADIDLDVVLDALYGPIYYRLMVPVAPISQEWISMLANLVMTAIAA